MIFFYELLFALVAIVAVFIGETWSRLIACVFLGGWLVVIALGYASFGWRLATSEGLSEEDRRLFTDVRDGLRHLRLLFGVATAAAVVWRLIAG